MYKSLYDIFKKWTCTDGVHQNAVYIYSDPHFNDDETKALRKNYVGDDEQVRRINSRVNKNDTIIFLGDIGDLDFIRKIRGYKVLIMGNHERGASNYIRKIKTIPGLFAIPQNKKLPYTFDEYNSCEKVRLAVEKSYPGLLYVEDRNITVDNHLFDEVYEGPLMVNDRLILSHEPIEGLPKYMFNIHGHDHSRWYKADNALNVCAEHINYTPVNLLSLLKNGLLKDTLSIHRTAINRANKRKKQKGSNNE